MREEKGITKQFIILLQKQKKWRIVIPILAFLIDLTLVATTSHSFIYTAVWWYGFRLLVEDSILVVMTNLFFAALSLWCMSGTASGVVIFLIPIAIIRIFRSYFDTHNYVLPLITGSLCIFLAGSIIEQKNFLKSKSFLFFALGILGITGVINMLTEGRQDNRP